NTGNNIHVSGLNSKVDSRDLENAFAKVGRVTKASIVYDPHTRESRQFGFVMMETYEEADAAIAALNGIELMGKVMTVAKVCVTETIPSFSLMPFSYRYTTLLTIMFICYKARRARARTPTPGKYQGSSKRRECE
ncbi:hypothetical protein K435DRAFT_592238, partial [Dendrothele bispora CBS 962.96]